MTDNRLSAAWLRPLLGLLATAGVLALSACGGGSGAPNNPYAPGPGHSGCTDAPAGDPDGLRRHSGDTHDLRWRTAVPRVFERHLDSAGEPCGRVDYDRPASGRGRCGHERDRQRSGLGRHHGVRCGRCSACVAAQWLDDYAEFGGLRHQRDLLGADGVASVTVTGAGGGGIASRVSQVRRHLRRIRDYVRQSGSAAWVDADRRNGRQRRRAGRDQGERRPRSRSRRCSGPPT